LLSSASERFCWWNAWVRNLIAYTDFFTLAGIALCRCATITFAQSRLARVTDFFGPWRAVASCILLWLLTFIILSPTIFEAPGFGTFRYDPEHGKCEISHQCNEAGEELEPELSYSGFYFLGANTVPCLVIMASYIAISLYLTAINRRLRTIQNADIPPVILTYGYSVLQFLDARVQVNTTKINRTYIMLALAYVMFTIPQLPLEFGLLDIHLKNYSAFISLCISSWYWWIYASNFLIYVVTDREFRIIFRIFLGDMALGLNAERLAYKILPPTTQTTIA
jgi:hypothetical protein